MEITQPYIFNYFNRRRLVDFMRNELEYDKRSSWLHMLQEYATGFWSILTTDNAIWKMSILLRNLQRRNRDRIYSFTKTMSKFSYIWLTISGIKSWKTYVTVYGLRSLYVYVLGYLYPFDFRVTGLKLATPECHLVDFLLRTRGYFHARFWKWFLIMGLGLSVTQSLCRLWISVLYMRQNPVELNLKERDIRCGFRDWFKEPVFDSVRESSHPFAAHERGEIRAQILNALRRLKLRAFVYDPSRNDIKYFNMDESKKRLPIFGVHREFYTNKDYQMKRVITYPDESDVVVMVDSDYYHDDLPEIAARNICVFYTFMPEHVSGTVYNGIFTTTKEDTVRLEVAGGASYEHKVWNWSTDHRTVDDFFGKTIIYTETRRVSPHRYVVLTVPICWVPHGNDFAEHNPLVRLRYHTGGFQAIRYMTTDPNPEQMISLMPHGYNMTKCVNIPHHKFVATWLSHNMMKDKSASVGHKHCSMLYDERRDYPDEMIFLFECINKIEPGFSPMLINISSGLAPAVMEQPSFSSVVPPKMERTTVLNENHDKPIEHGRAVHHPIQNSATLINDNEASQHDTVSTRIEANAVKISKKGVESSVRHAKLMMKTLFPNSKHTLTPLTTDEVNNIMTKPSQRLGFQQCITALLPMNEHFPAVQAFIKQEAAATPAKSKRVIMPVSKEHRVNLSCYTLAVARFVKQFPWYAFGKAPPDIARRVHEVASRAKHLVTTDCSGFDSTHNNATQAAAIARLCYLFPPEEHDTIKHLYAAQSDLVAHIGGKNCDHGVNFETAKILLSGSPDTSIGNTLDQLQGVFNSFLYSKNPKTGVLFKPEEIIDYLGVYGGDDGFTPDIEPEALRKGFTDLGYKIKIEKVTKPDEAVTFLARTYPNPCLSMGSYSDIKRVLSKIHLTNANSSVSDSEIYKRKAKALLTTDPQTPILSELGDLYYRSAGCDTSMDRLEDISNEELSWNAMQCIITKTNYPHCEFMDIVESQICMDLDIPTPQLSQIRDSIRKCKHVRDLIVPELPWTKWITTRDILVDGDLFTAGEGVDQYGMRIGASTPKYAKEPVGLKRNNKKRPGLQIWKPKPNVPGLTAPLC